MSLVEILQSYWHVFLFYICVALVVYLNRKKFAKEGIVYLFRTKIGLAAMDRWSGKFGALLRIAGLSAIGFAFTGIILVIILLLFSLYQLLVTDSTIGASPVVPGAPIMGTGMVFPLITGWICIFIIMVVHEFSHGVIARAYGNKVKSSGIAFIGPILGAFVEPDEKELSKRPDHEQYAVFAAGPISNVALALLAILLSSFVVAPFLSSVSMPDGIKIDPEADLPAKVSGLSRGDIVIELNGIRTHNLSEFQEVSQGLKPGENVVLKTKTNTYSFAAVENPNNSSRGYMGVKIIGNTFEPKSRSMLVQFHSLQWLDELLFWIYLISLSIGLMNLLPIYITDGARMLKLALDKGLKNKKTAKTAWLRINNVCLGIVVLLFIIPIIKIVLFQ